MAGIYTAQYSSATKTISIGELDQLMDAQVNAANGTLGRAELLTIALSFRAIDIISGAVSRLPYNIYRGETEVTEAETPRYWSDLQYKLCESYLLFNAAYCLKETNQYGANAQWRFLPTPKITIEKNLTTRQLSGFRYDGLPIENYEKRLLWWWWPNILEEVGPGSGPTDAALNDATLIKYLTDFASAYFQRGGFPVTLLLQSGPISPDDQTRLEHWWNSMIAGVKRAFRAVLISNKIEPKQIGSNIKDTVAPELYQQSAHNVAIAYGIPISILLSDAANYATSLEDHVKFYTETVIPIAERMIEVWNERVYEPQGLLYELEPEQLEVMQQYELQKAQTLMALTGAPIITVDEAREIMGYDPMPQPATPAQPQPAEQQPPRDSTDNTDAIDQGDEAKTDQRIIVERERMRRKAHNCLTTGKVFAFRSDIVSAADVEALKACTTHEAIDALNFDNVKRSDGLFALIDAIAGARAELKAATALPDPVPMSFNFNVSPAGVTVTPPETPINVTVNPTPVNISVEPTPVNIDVQPSPVSVSVEPTPIQNTVNVPVPEPRDMIVKIQRDGNDKITGAVGAVQ